MVKRPKMRRNLLKATATVIPRKKPPNPSRIVTTRLKAREMVDLRLASGRCLAWSMDQYLNEVRF